MAVLNGLAKAARGGFMDWRRGISTSDCVEDIHDCEAVIQKAKRHLAALIVDRMTVERKIATLGRVIRKSEAEIAELLESEDQALAMFVAEDVLSYEAQRERLRQLHTDISQLEQAISRNLYDDIQIIKRLRATLLAQSQARRTGRDTNVVELRDIRQTLGRIRSNQQWSAGILTTRERLEAELHPRSLSTQQPRPSRQQLEEVLYRVVKRHLVV
jgi:hypothetical protein